MPLDINLFRKEGGNPDLIRESQRRRGAPVESVDAIIAKDDEWRALTGQADELRKQRNVIQKEIAGIMKASKGGAATPEVEAKKADLLNQKSTLDAAIITTETTQATLKVEIDKMVGKIGNIVAPDVPDGSDEDTCNRVERTWGTPRKEAGLLNHHDLLWRIGGYEPERGAGVAGHRGYFLRDVGVMLNQALINFGIAFLRRREYCVLQPPYLMRREVMAGVAQLEQFDEELYKVSGGSGAAAATPEGTNGDGGDLYLIATSEQPICAYHKDEWLDEKALPLRYAGVSTCFRKEAGSHGRDTWGIFRVHQFEKVEQFAITTCDQEVSDAMQHEMIAAAEEFYQTLGLPYHVINICSGALNNAALRKLDLEAWFPGYDSYRELVSCSNCSDYQSRAMEIRCGAKKMGEREKRYVHMLNATLCATGRVICCILENYQEANGVRVPEALIPFMGGIDFLPFVRDSKISPPPAPAAKGAAKPAAKAASAPDAAKVEEVAPAAAPAAAPADDEDAEKKAKKKAEKDAKKAEKAAAKKAANPVYVTTPVGGPKPFPEDVSTAPEQSSQSTAGFNSSGLSLEVPSTTDVIVDGAVALPMLESRLQYFSFVAGDAPGAEDVTTFGIIESTVGVGALTAFPAVSRWARFVAASPESVRATW